MMIHTKARRGLAFILSVLSILANFEWVILPFSFYGLRGRSGILYGQYTLLQTFSFHPAGRVWWALTGLQVFAALAIVAGALIGLGRVSRSVVLLLPAIGLLMLDSYVAFRWGTLALWSMYAIGAIPGILLLGAAACSFGSSQQ